MDAIAKQIEIYERRFRAELVDGPVVRSSPWRSVPRCRAVVSSSTRQPSCPESTTLNLVVDDEGDDLDDEERSALDAHLTEARKSVQAGRVRPADELLA